MVSKYWKKFFCSGFNYKKIGVTLVDLKIKSKKSDLDIYNHTSPLEPEDYIIQGNLFNVKKILY